MTVQLKGVFCAALTPLRADLAPDHAVFVEHCRSLLAQGCDGVALLGTTGEANSFAVAERKALLESVTAAGISPTRLLPGTGVSSLTETVELTRHALALGVTTVLMLPPFYYKGVPDDGLAAYIGTIVKATSEKPIPIYLYHFPSQSGLPWHVKLIARLLDAHKGRIVGLKDSSGDMAYARAAAGIAKAFDVFPSTEACLIEARSGVFAGCISATANLNADLCQQAWASGDAAALDAAVTIRKLFDGKPLVSGVKSTLAHIHGDPAWARVAPPLAPFAAADRASANAGYDAARAKRVA